MQPSSLLLVFVLLITALGAVLLFATLRLNEQIADSLASGLLVVDVAGAVQILNPAGRRLLGVTATEPAGPFVHRRSGQEARQVRRCPSWHAVSRRDR